MVIGRPGNMAMASVIAASMVPTRDRTPGMFSLTVSNVAWGLAGLLDRPGLSFRGRAGVGWRAACRRTSWDLESLGERGPELKTKGSRPALGPFGGQLVPPSPG